MCVSGSVSGRFVCCLKNCALCNDVVLLRFAGLVLTIDDRWCCHRRKSSLPGGRFWWPACSRFRFYARIRPRLGNDVHTNHNQKMNHHHRPDGFTKKPNYGSSVDLVSDWCLIDLPVEIPCRNSRSNSIRFMDDPGCARARKGEEGELCEHPSSFASSSFVLS
jgi:hypothetical protein